MGILCKLLESVLLQINSNIEDEYWCQECLEDVWVLNRLLDLMGFPSAARALL